MFQYACGRAIAARNGGSLRLDVSDIASSSLAVPRRYGLHVFNLDAKILGPKERARLLEALTKSRLSQIWRWISGRRAAQVNLRRLAEAHYHFDPLILAAGDNVYLDGYFQSEKYFCDQAKVIRRDFTLGQELEARLNRDLLAQVDRCESVSLHIRRGDYVSQTETNRFHGVCPPEYYRCCTEYVASQVRNPVLFLFSDDPDWVRENLHLSHPVIQVSNGRLKDYEELAMMSRCRHHIIANSSFSWWGAWLDPRPDKIVCAPEQWFANKCMNTADLIPEGWIRL